MPVDGIPNKRQPRRSKMTADRLVPATLAAILLTLPGSASAVMTFTDAGIDAGSIQDTVEAFRMALGDPNNGNTPGPLVGGRREINWDGGGNPDGSPAGTPFAGFQNRGAIFETPGTGFQQAPVATGMGSLSEVFNTDYSGTFAAFSPVRLFVPEGSNQTDGFFSIPGSNGAIGATVAGFGAVFSDVDLPDVTTIEFFGAFGDLLTTLAVPAQAGNQTFSFAGVLFDASEPGIRRVRITTGNAALGVADGGGVDVVAMDDFFFSEPVPEPATLLLVGSGLGLSALRWRRQRRR
jgi:PEP-CTERM motif